jgi:hypothetical protein
MSASFIYLYCLWLDNKLYQTAKDEYDASLEEDAKQPEATGSIFQGLRADLDG